MNSVYNSNVEDKILANLTRHLSLSVFVTDIYQRVVYRVQSKNSSFDNAPVRECQGRLHCSHFALRRELNLAYTSLHETPKPEEKSGGNHSDQKQILHTDSDDFQWRITIAPAIGFAGNDSLSEMQYYFLTLKHVSHSQDDMHHYLTNTWGLSPRETEITMRLVQKQNLKTIAGECFLSYQTTRWYLKEIFKKTGVHRQQELISLVMSQAT